MFRANLESITFMKVRKIMYLDKAYCKEECLSLIKKQTEIQQDMTVPFARARAKLGGSIR